MAMSAYRPPNSKPLTAISSSRLMPVPLPPVRLGNDGIRGRVVPRPYHFVLAVLPLAHHAGGGPVDSVDEPDGPDHRLELVGVVVFLDPLPVEAHFGHRLLQDLQAGVGRGAGPAVRFLPAVGHVGFEVLPGS